MNRVRTPIHRLISVFHTQGQHGHVTQQKNSTTSKPPRPVLELQARMEMAHILPTIRTSLIERQIGRIQFGLRTNRPSIPALRTISSWQDTWNPWFPMLFFPL